MNKFFDSIKEILDKNIVELNKIKINHEKFKGLFPDNIKNGLIIFSKNTKEITAGYFYFSASLSPLLFKIEQNLSALPSIMLQADKEQQSNTVILCDKILTDYNGFKRSTCDFLEKCEIIISRNEYDQSLSELYALLVKYEQKIKNYSDELDKLKATI